MLPNKKAVVFIINLDISGTSNALSFVKSMGMKILTRIFALKKGKFFKYQRPVLAKQTTEILIATPMLFNDDDVVALKTENAKGKQKKILPYDFYFLQPESTDFIKISGEDAGRYQMDSRYKLDRRLWISLFQMFCRKRNPFILDVSPKYFTSLIAAATIQYPYAAIIHNKAYYECKYLFWS